MPEPELPPYETLVRSGDMHLFAGRVREALQDFEKAVHLNPNRVEAYNDAAVSWTYAGYPSNAEKILKLCAAKALPTMPQLLCNMANCMQSQFRQAEAATLFRLAWEINGASVYASNWLLCCQYLPELTAGELAAAARVWGQTVAACVKRLPVNRPKMTGRRLNIGFVSPDYRDHSIVLFTEHLFENLDRKKFKLFGYSDGKFNDAVTERVGKKFDAFENTLALGDADMAAKIAADGIDILIDLSGHAGTARAAMFGCKPAPIQCAWLGYPATTGNPAVDYYVTDTNADPNGCEKYYTERLYRLPTAHCFRPPEYAPPVRVAPFASSEQVMFGYVNREMKLNRQMISHYAAVARVIPNSRFIFKTPNAHEPLFQETVRGWFAQEGIPGDHMEFIQFRASREEYLKLYDRIDFCLDSYPYTGTTTTCEAMYQGVAVLSVTGPTHRERASTAVMEAGGFRTGFFTCAKPEDLPYLAQSAVVQASKLGEKFRPGIRARLQNSLLLNEKAFADSFGAMLTHMAALWDARGDALNEANSGHLELAEKI